ncbi:AEC family transporter [Streptomyces sp. ISL-10]|uniref:AEC family transporter n=1 Tax=Streptomyces sp. ISL-10 TaxID=2819172 RepID=UPI001BEC6568|nr:AEC family transporter [Streptomyces sp. ISL-10]MBT2369880.1 AEC family transporter [Streptomyces sp. ISL-10]
MTVLSGFLPIWAITAVGWAAGRYDVLGKQAQSVLGRFAFAFAMPALLFLTLARADVSRLATLGLAVFAVSVLVVFAIGLLLGRRVFRRRPGDRAIGAMAGSYVNSANLGIPVAVHVLDDASFVIAAALFQTLFITPLILVLIDLDAGGSATRERFRRILRLPLHNPIIAASAAGITVAALGWQLPHAVTEPVRMLSGAAVPAALFALGMSLNAGRGGKLPPAGEPRPRPGGAGAQEPAGPPPRSAALPVGGSLAPGPGGPSGSSALVQKPAAPPPPGGRLAQRPAAPPRPAGPLAHKTDAPPRPTAFQPVARRAERQVLVALKTVVQPLLAYALARWAFGLDGHDLFAVVLCAGLPTAQNAFIFASEYRLDTALARDTVLMSTFVSMGSLSLITWLLA